jgi:hypothetical protein
MFDATDWDVIMNHFNENHNEREKCLSFTLLDEAEQEDACFQDFR